MQVTIYLEMLCLTLRNSKADELVTWLNYFFLFKKIKEIKDHSLTVLYRERVELK